MLWMSVFGRPDGFYSKTRTRDNGYPDLSYQRVPPETSAWRPVIIGLGPAGPFIGLILPGTDTARSSSNGEDADARVRKIEQFWSGGQIDPDINVQFGEGGAGSFSDGKLTTLINDSRCRLILEEFVRAGAPAEILYKSKPHIGTDLLRTIVKEIRREIIARGGEVRFQAKVSDFIIKDSKLTGWSSMTRRGSVVTSPCWDRTQRPGYFAICTARCGHDKNLFPLGFALNIRRSN